MYVPLALKGGPANGRLTEESAAAEESLGLFPASVEHRMIQGPAQSVPISPRLLPLG